MVDFHFTKEQDRYYVKNTGAISITYTVQKLSDCFDFLTIYDGIIEPGRKVEITTLGDGEYRVVMINELLEEHTIPIKHYLELQLSVIEDIYSTICECECGCSDCVELDCDKITAILIARTKLDAYKRVMNPQFTSFFNIINTRMKCMLDEKIYCGITEEKIKGSSKYNEELSKKLLALDFLAIYFYEKFTDCFSCDKEYTYRKFRINKILCCISKLGINIKDIENLIEDNISSMHINSAAYVNQPPSEVGDYELYVENRTTIVFTLDMFTTLTTPVYSDPENDPVQSVRIDSLPTVGILYYNDIPVTVGQIIIAQDVVDGLLKYVSPDSDLVSTDSFLFSLSDTGSGQFTS